MNKEDIHELVRMQRDALPSPLSYEERMRLLTRLYELILQNEKEISAALQEDLGKCEAESYMTEIGIVLEEITFTKKHLRKWMRPEHVPTPLAQFPAKSLIYHEPYGSVLIMAPWNYPFQLTMAPMVGAIAAGNRCVLKPSNYSPATSKMIEKIVTKWTTENICFVVTGGREENQALLDEKFDYIFFTGGVTVGKLVMEKAAQHVTPLSLELGGKSPCIVEKTADVKQAARAIAFGKGLNCGQTCVAPDYVLVDKTLEDALIDGIVKEWQGFYGEDALKNPNWPKMVNQKHYTRVMGLIDNENIVCGGEGDGQKIAPTLLRDVKWDAPVMQEEIFGPVLPVIAFECLDDALDKVTSREKPLALYLFTKDKAVEKRVIENVPYGGGCVNDTIVHLATPYMGFGGVGQSGMGGYHGKRSFMTFSHEKSVLVRGGIDLPVRYAPYTKKKLNLIKKLLK